MALDDYLAHFRARVLQDALAEVIPAYWQRRAQTFAAVGTPACDEIAQACLNHGRFLANNPLIDPAELDDFIRESA